jgi:hypothetical protein
MAAETHTKRGAPPPERDVAHKANQLNLAETSMTINAESGSQLAALSMLRDQVYDTWIPKCDEEIAGLSPAEWFASAEIDGDICFKAYSPAALRALQDMDRLYWKEECLYEDVLKGISMPLDPARSFAGRAEGPIILVRCPERDVVMVVNGNHRVGAVMREEFNPTNSPLFVVEFANPRVYEQFTGAPLTRTSYLAIDVREGGRPRK